ncbi:MAG: phage tail length tape measure family protein [Rhizobiaceae bacterium]|nr:phage tail length tape measure family protein [Rhizobiaceae bacterium]
MADKTDDLVIGVSTDMAAVQRALKRLDSDIARTSGQIEKRFSSIGKSIDNSMTSAMQTRIDAMTGVATKATKEWTGALAQQGQEMDRLRAKFSPVFSTITSYKSSINEIRTAHRLGAISTDEMTAAIQRERQAALASIAAIKGRNAALADTPPVMGGAIGPSGNAFQSANIAAQFQDIAVMTQMGIANPLTIALQQGTQLSAVFNTMGGAKDVIRGIGAAFMSIVNPVSLVTIGTIAAGVAAYNYFSESEEGAEATAEALKEQANLIQSVAQKWGDALPAIRAYAAEQDRLAGRDDLEQATQQEIARVFGDIGQEVVTAGDAITDVMDLLRNTAPPDQLVALQSALAALSDSAADNKTSVEEMEAAQRAALDLLASTGLPVFQDTADAIGAMIPELAAVREQIAEIEDSKAGAQAIADLQAEIANISSAKAREELTALLEQARSSEISIEELINKLAEVSGYAPDVSGIVGAFVSVARAAAVAANATASINSQGGPQTRGRYGRFPQLPGSAPTPNQRPNDIQRLDWQAEAEERAARATRGGRRGGGGGGGHSRRTADDRFFEDIEAIKQRTIALAEEQAQLGLSFEAQQKRKVAFELEQKALKDVREAARQKGEQDWQNATLSEGQIKQIDEVSEAYARQASELKNAQDQMSFQRDVVNGIMTDVRSALEDGKITTEEWGNIFLNVIDKITDRLQDQLLDALFEVGSATKGSGGGGGGLFGGLFGSIGKLFGFSQGTANTGGQRGQPRGIVHGQEAVIPLPNGGKVPVQIQAPQAPAIAVRGAGGTETIRVVLEDDSGRMAAIADQRITTHSGTIVQVSVRESTRAVKNGLPSMMAEAQSRAA